jgi:hypothetical protein
LVNFVDYFRINFIGFNLLLLAANKGCDKEIFDFLLKRGVSATEMDSVDRYGLSLVMSFYPFN